MPKIILIQPQLGENIGMVARAMLNCGLTELRLVNPRDGWPSGPAIAAACGATQVLDRVKVYTSTEDAIADLVFIAATTARPRDMTKPVFSPASLPDTLASYGREKCGILFGPERSGLDNDDIALADAILNIPLNPDFTSLNLAQAVLIVGYALFQEPVADKNDVTAAQKDELIKLMDHLNDSLESSGFFTSAEKMPGMKRTIRNMVSRMGLTTEDVRTMRGIIKSLARQPKS